MMTSRLGKLLTFTLITAVAVAGLLELSLQTIYRVHTRLRSATMTKLAGMMDPPFSWERRFLERCKTGEFVYQSLHAPHATRGWTLKPGLHVEHLGFGYTTNSQGFRSLYPYVHDGARFETLIVGDSFTFGSEVHDEETWPHLLQQTDTRLNVLNLAVGGYGIDQMYITLREELSNYQPNVVIVAFIHGDLARATLDFRDYMKPRFKLENDTLVLTNTPVGGISEVCAELEERNVNDSSSIQTVKVFRALQSTAHGGPRDSRCDGACLALNARLLERMAAIAEAVGAEFLPIYLASGTELDPGRGRRPSDGEVFFENSVANHAQYALNTCPELERAPFEKTRSHYRKPEHELVASSVYAKIRTLPSWRRFMAVRTESGGATPSIDGERPHRVKYLSVSETNTVRQEWGATLDGRNAAGGPLVIAGQTFQRGIGTHATSEMTFALHERWRWFRSTIGIDGGACDSGSVRFGVFLDGELALESDLLVSGEHRQVEVEIGDALTMKLVVSDGADGITCDAANWVDARLVS